MGVGTGYGGGRGAPVKGFTRALQASSLAGNPHWRATVGATTYAKHAVVMTTEHRSSACCSQCKAYLRRVQARPHWKSVERECLQRTAANHATQLAIARGEPPTLPRKERSMGTRELREQKVCGNRQCPAFNQLIHRDLFAGGAIRGNVISTACHAVLQRGFAPGAPTLPPPPSPYVHA